MRVGYVLRHRELKEDKVQKFITFKQEFDEYGLKFTQLSHHSPKMVAH